MSEHMLEALRDSVDSLKAIYGKRSAAYVADPTNAEKKAAYEKAETEYSDAVEQLAKAEVASAMTKAASTQGGNDAISS